MTGTRGSGPAGEAPARDQQPKTRIPTLRSFRTGQEYMPLQCFQPLRHGRGQISQPNALCGLVSWTSSLTAKQFRGLICKSATSTSSPQEGVRPLGPVDHSDLGPRALLSSAPDNDPRYRMFTAVRVRPAAIIFLLLTASLPPSSGSAASNKPKDFGTSQTPTHLLHGAAANLSHQGPRLPRGRPGDGVQAGAQS